MLSTGAKLVRQLHHFFYLIFACFPWKTVLLVKLYSCMKGTDKGLAWSRQCWDSKERPVLGDMWAQIKEAAQALDRNSLARQSEDPPKKLQEVSVEEGAGLEWGQSMPPSGFTLRVVGSHLGC